MFRYAPEQVLDLALLHCSPRGSLTINAFSQCGYGRDEFINEMFVVYKVLPACLFPERGGLVIVERCWLMAGIAGDSKKKMPRVMMKGGKVEGWKVIEKLLANPQL